MQDVPLQASVFTATVSQALIRPEKVSPATLLRERRSACNINYAPLSTGRPTNRYEGIRFWRWCQITAISPLSEVLHGI